MLVKSGDGSEQGDGDDGKTLLEVLAVWCIGPHHERWADVPASLCEFRWGDETSALPSPAMGGAVGFKDDHAKPQVVHSNLSNVTLDGLVTTVLSRSPHCKQSTCTNLGRAGADSSIRVSPSKRYTVFEDLMAQSWQLSNARRERAYRRAEPGRRALPLLSVV